MLLQTMFKIPKCRLKDAHVAEKSIKRIIRVQSCAGLTSLSPSAELLRTYKGIKGLAPSYLTWWAAFSFHAPMLWNGRPQDIRSASSVVVLKPKLKARPLCAVSASYLLFVCFPIIASIIYY